MEYKKLIDIHSHILLNMDDGAFSADRRNPILSKAVTEASKIIGQKPALDLVQTNPQKIILCLTLLLK